MLLCLAIVYMQREGRGWGARWPNNRRGRAAVVLPLGHSFVFNLYTAPLPLYIRCILFAFLSFSRMAFSLLLFFFSGVEISYFAARRTVLQRYSWSLPPRYCFRAERKAFSAFIIGRDMIFFCSMVWIEGWKLKMFWWKYIWRDEGNNDSYYTSSWKFFENFCQFDPYILNFKWKTGKWSFEKMLPLFLHKSHSQKISSTLYKKNIL